MGKGTGGYDAKTGKFTMTPAADSGATGGLAPEAFGAPKYGTGYLTVADGANSGPNANCGDTSQGIASQANSFCAAVTISNQSSDNFSLVWVQFSNFSPATVSLAVSQTGTDTMGSALSGYLTNGSASAGEPSAPRAQLRRRKHGSSCFRTCRPMA